MHKKIKRQRTTSSELAEIVAKKAPHWFREGAFFWAVLVSLCWLTPGNYRIIGVLVAFGCFWLRGQPFLCVKNKLFPL